MNSLSPYPAPDGGERQGEIMHAVVRNYPGNGAKVLFELLEQRKADVEQLLRDVPGFRAYTLMHCTDGGVSVTICGDKAGRRCQPQGGLGRTES